MYTYVESAKPTMSEICKHIRDEAASRWYNLGMLLVVPVHQLNIIQMNYPHDTEMCCTQMFRYWLQTDTEASWSKLLNALRNMAQNSLADKIKTEILFGM